MRFATSAVRFEGLQIESVIYSVVKEGCWQDRRERNGQEEEPAQASTGMTNERGLPLGHDWVFS